MLKIGVEDTFGESGPAVELLKKYGLDSESIYAKVVKFLNPLTEQGVENFKRITKKFLENNEMIGDSLFFT